MAPLAVHLAEHLDAIRHDAIDAEVEKVPHLPRVVDRPDVYLQAEAVGVGDEAGGDQAQPALAGWDLHGDGAGGQFAAVSAMWVRYGPRKTEMTVVEKAELAQS